MFSHDKIKMKAMMMGTTLVVGLSDINHELVT